jgi:hypothetical protein
LASALLLACGAAYAQSGRRAPRSSAPPEAVGEASASPSPTPAPAGPRRDLKGVTLLVGVEFKGGADGPAARVIFDNFAVHLANAGAKVSSLGESKREVAVKRAQSEAEAYVVWLQLEKDSFQNGQIVVNSPDLAVKYSVFEPRTGESKAKGKVFYQAMAGPRGRAGSTDPVKITAEAAGIEAADRVIDWFMLVRNQPPPGRP